jgi:hypothetical protein
MLQPAVSKPAQNAPIDNHEGDLLMWKILVGFAVFAALALFLLSKGGNIDMGGEQHGVSHEPAAASAPAAPAASAAAESAAPASAAASS